MTDLQARAEAAADAVCGSRKNAGSWHLAYRTALHALQSEGWRPASEAPITLPGGRPAYWMLIRWDGRTLIACKEASGEWTTYGGERLVALEPTHFMPLPAPPEGEGA